MKTGKAKRQWRVTHQIIEKPDALSRWDRAYQCLLHLTVKNGSVILDNAIQKLPLPTPVNQEVNNSEDSNLCQSFNTASDPIADH